MLRWFEDPLTRTLIVAVAVTVASVVALPVWAFWCPAPLSPGSEKYLGEAITVIKAHAYHARHVDWDQAERIARSQASGAESPAATHDAIRTMLDKLGDRRSRLIPAGSAPTTTPDIYGLIVEKDFLLSDGTMLRILSPRIAARGAQIPL